MGCALRFIVLSRNEGCAAELRALFREVGDIKVVAEVEEPALLLQAVRQFPVDVVLVDLDPAPELILPVIAEVASAEPDMAIFALLSTTDGQLILDAMRSGIREFFPRPIDGKTFSEAIEKVASKQLETGSQGKLITVMGVSGGAGATVLATNLAVELVALAKGGVTIVDLDYRFGQVATLLDVEPTYTLADLCNSPERLEQTVVTRALVKHQTGVKVLSRPSSFSQADTITAASCVGLLLALLQFNEYVVADGPIRFDPGARAVLEISDANLLVTQLLVPHVRNSARILDGMRESGCSMEKTKLICNRVGRDSGHLSVKDISDTLSLPAFASIPDDWASVSGAINLGEPLLTHSPKSKARMSIEEIAARLHGPEQEADDKETRKKGLIGRIFTSA